MQGDEYQIKHSDNFENLLFDFEECENLPFNKVPFPGPPGRRQNVTYDFGREADRYYAIRTSTVWNYDNVEVVSEL